MRADSTGSRPKRGHALPAVVPLAALAGCGSREALGRLLLRHPDDDCRMRVEAHGHVAAFGDVVEQARLAPQDVPAKAHVLGLHHQGVATRPTAFDEARLFIGGDAQVESRLDPLEAEEYGKDGE